MKTEVVNDQTIRAWGMVFVTSYLIKRANDILGNAIPWSTKSNRYHWKHIIKDNIPLLLQAERLRKLQLPLLTGTEDYDTEVLTNELDNQLTLVESFVKLFWHQDPMEAGNMEVYFRELLAGRKLYTEKEVKYIMEQLGEEQPINMYL